MNKNLTQTDADEEVLPPWLAQELEDGDVIPMPDGNQSTGNTNKMNGSSDDVKSRVNDAASITKGSGESDVTSRYRIKELEAQNLELMRKVKEQDAMIKALKKQNEIYAESNKRLLALSGEMTR